MTNNLIPEKMMNAPKLSPLEKEALRELITYVRTAWSGAEFRRFGSRASSFMVSSESWKNGMLSLLPIHRAIEDEGIAL